MLQYIPEIIKLIFIWTEFLILTPIMYIFSYSHFQKNKYFKKSYRFFFRYWSKLFCKAGRLDIRVHQKHLKLLPKQYIVIANHPSMAEDAGMVAVFNARFIAKEEVASWPVFGRITKAAGTVYVKREDSNSRKAAKLKLDSVIKDGDNLGVYVEGGCKGVRIHLPFKSGAFETSVNNNVPIIPVLIHYEAVQDFAWHRVNNGKGTHGIKKFFEIFFAKNHICNYYIFDPIHPKDFSDKVKMREYIEQFYLKQQEKYLV